MENKLEILKVYGQLGLGAIIALLFGLSMYLNFKVSNDENAIMKSNLELEKDRADIFERYMDKQTRYMEDQAKSLDELADIYSGRKN